MTTGQVRGRRPGTEHADLPLIISGLFLGLPVGGVVQIEATVSLRHLPEVKLFRV